MPTGVYVRQNAVCDRLKAEWPRTTRPTLLNGSRAPIHATYHRREDTAACELDALGARGRLHASSIREAHAASFALIEAGHRPRFRGDLNKDAVECAKLFIAYLEDQGVMTRLPTKSAAPLVAVWAWAREQRGLAKRRSPRILGRLPFVDALGDIPTAYDAVTIRAYMIERAKAVSVERMKGIGRHPRVLRFRSRQDDVRLARPRHAECCGMAAGIDPALPA